MATDEVPGHNPANHDTLHQGCWAEHDDGSMLRVDSCENSVVVYSLFDLSKDPPIEFRDAMSEKDFKREYSWPNSHDKWTWHDKTAFPWDRIMTNFPAGQRYASAEGLKTAAERVAERMGLRGSKFRKGDVDHLAERVVAAGSGILDRISRAIRELGR